AGIPIFENFGICLVLLFQFFPGILIWETINPQDSNSPVSIGAGITIGICSATLSRQLLLHTMFSSFSLLFPVILAILILINNERVAFTPTQRNVFYDRTLTVIIPFLTVWGLQDQWWWLLPICIVMGGVIALVMFTDSDAQYRFIKLSKFSKISIAALIVTATSIATHLRSINYSWWIISNDTPFGESLSFSVNKWGSTSDISALGQSVSYHWFAYAWSGLTSDFASAQSWTILTVVLPIISCLVISLLVWALFFEWTDSILSAFIGCAVVLLIRNVISTSSPSQIFSFMPAMLFLIVGYRSLDRRVFRISDAVLLLMLTFVLIGSKISTGVVFISGFLLVLISSTSIKTRYKSTIFSIIAIVAMCSYKIFFDGPRGNITPRIGHGNAGGLIMMGRPFWSQFSFIFDWVALLLISAPFLCWPLYVLLQTRKDRISNIVKLLSSSICISLLCTALIDAAGTETYFLYVGSFMANLLGVFLVVSALLDERVALTWRSTLFFSLIGLVLGVCRINLSDWVSSRDSRPLIPLYLLPYFLLCLFT
ncbi:MAG: hypothetical protein WCR08_14435, partial [Gammaproteobacteria bacterium]